MSKGYKKGYQIEWDADNLIGGRIEDFEKIVLSAPTMEIGLDRAEDEIIRQGYEDIIGQIIGYIATDLGFGIVNA